MHVFETVIAKIILCLGVVLACSFSEVRAQDDTNNNYRVEKFNESNGNWENASGSGKYDVGQGELADVTEGDVKWFEWADGETRYRLREDRIPKDSIKEGLQDAADNDVSIRITVNSDGTFQKVELKDK